MAKPLVPGDLWNLIEPLLAKRRIARLKGGWPPLDDRKPVTGILGGLSLHAGGVWELLTGPNPVDRRKHGSKHHLLTDACGVPMAKTLTGANRHDVTQLLPLVDGVPPIAGKPLRPDPGRPGCSEPDRKALRQRDSTTLPAGRGAVHGSGLGKTHWPVERTLSWLHQKRRLRMWYEKCDDIHLAFMLLAEVMSCWNILHRPSVRGS